MTYVDSTAAVVLDDLVISTVGATTDNVGCAVALDGDGILADILEPHVLEGASAQAVDTLLLVGTDDHVLQGRALLQYEDSVSLATLAGATGAGTTVVLDPAGVKALAGTDVHGLGERLRAGGAGHAAVVGEAGHGRGHSGGEGEDSCGGRHFENLVVRG